LYNKVGTEFGFKYYRRALEYPGRSRSPQGMFMPANNTEIEKRLWEAANELREAQAETEKERCKIFFF
jgi:hypothetical protein